VGRAAHVVDARRGEVAMGAGRRSVVRGARAGKAARTRLGEADPGALPACPTRGLLPQAARKGERGVSAEGPGQLPTIFRIRIIDVIFSSYFDQETVPRHPTLLQTYFQGRGFVHGKFSGTKRALYVESQAK